MNYLFKQTYEVLQALFDYIETYVFNKIGAAGGLATLNEDGKVPNSQIGIETMTQAEASEGAVEDGRLTSPKVLVTTIDEKVSPLADDVEALDERTDNINERLETVEQLAEISIGGGDIGIATAEDFDDPSAAQRAKVPTVGAILDCMDEVPTTGSTKPVQSGGVVKDMFLMEFVGRGNTFVENQDTCINWIKGHTYRIYPYVTEWDWGTTSSVAKVFQLGYVKTDDTKVLVADVPRGTTIPNIEPYYDLTLPDDGSVKSLMIGGRAASGYIVKCVVVDITYTNDVSASIQSQIDEVETKLDDIAAIQNYIDGKQVISNGSITDNTDTFISENIPVQQGDVINWRYSDVSERCYLSIRDADNNKLAAYTSNNTSNNGLRKFTVGEENAAYLIATFFKKDGYEPYITVNGNKVWVKKDDGRLTEVEKEIDNIDAEIEKLDNKDNYRLPYQNGYVRGSNGNIVSLEGLTASTNYGWKCSSKYIPVQEGDIVTWEYGKSSSATTGPCLVQYDSDKQYVTYYPAANGTNGVRKITIPVNVKFIRISWFRENTFTNTPITIPVKVNDKEYFIDGLSEVQRRVDVIAPIITDFGVVGELYPNEIDDLTKVLTDRSNRFQFIHLSDNHNSTFASAPEMLDKTSADFIINTGDMVADKFTDSAATTLAEMQSPTKPVYITLGNHDVYRAPTMQDVFDKFFPTMNAHNETSFDKTYYAFDVDKGGNLFKCIFLNPYDGFPDLPNTSINTIVSGNMSSEQVVWFIGQLQDAATSGRHVCLFMHTIPTYYDKDSLDFFQNWRDKKQMNTTLDVSRNLEYLLEIVDAFIDGTSYEYSGTTYNFSAVGKFVAWFAGHTHYDMIGRVYEHPNQWAVNVCRPTNTQGTAYRGKTPGITWNYVTIDADIRSLAIYRVGQQQTVFGVKRDVVRVFY